MQRPETAADLSTVPAFRSPALGRIVVAAIRKASANVQRAFARYRKRRQMKASYDVLCCLDDRMLRDLGFHRSEIMPVTAEIAEEAEHTRMRYLHELLR